MLTFSQLASITHGSVLQFVHDLPVQHLLTDSRKLAQPASTLFFAIKGAFNDGHDYVSALYARGVRQFIVEQVVEIPGVKSGENFKYSFPEANFLLAENSLTALQEIAAFHRGEFLLPVMAITGSNGKTIVKEWLAQLLSPDEKVVKSPRSYNSQIGVPLSVWQINANHTFGIFEAGISMVSEMEKLARIIRPTLGIFTNVGTAHDEGFENSVQKIEEKLLLFKDVKLLFYSSDEKLLDEAVKREGIKSFTWGHRPDADLQILSQQISGAKTSILYKFEGNENQISIPFTDPASVQNTLHCLAVLVWRGMASETMQQRFDKLLPVAMRLEMKEAINNCYLIDDTYNNDLAGLSTALDLLVHQKRHQQKTVILSDLLESGLNEETLYSEVAAALKNRGVDRLIGIGKVISRHRLKFSMKAEFYTNTADFLQHFQSDSFHNETILVKGARVFEFEKIVALFGKKVHGTVLEVNLNALVHNLNFYRSKLQPETKIMVMVKAFAYGSGSYEIANILQFHRVDYLAVAYTDEGVLLRENGISLPIMVMNPSADSFAQLLRYHLEPEIYSLSQLRSFLTFIHTDSAPAYHIHLKLDTGMHRLGFTKPDFEELFTLLQTEPRVQVASIFSHLAGADEALHNDFSKQQITSFREMAAEIESKIGYSVTKHILNSAGIVRFPEHHLDMVRLGIGLYGVEATGTEQDALQNVGTLKTTISQIKHIQQGDTVGYSRRGLAETDLEIATLAIGYADGYDRRFGNGNGEVLINGQTAPIIGNVCMDMCMVNVTGLQVSEGDEVVVFGQELPITKLAAKINTIPYELLTNVSPRVKRVFYSE
ncbi:bifunctional UDP-N-acetylmuramoyl-tripeptide:D-alanyl-D-alanine ligase/alanine racemase [Adhaeribacter sp. BT258]|uniref:Alanine racemase n=1 Tax=Adhaeribacter terrigena TaxID=2793070 RepID=A0ABS1C6P4_9BACT|nr:bifunctional UDP-N-acetylmuramoyl-tripeptide:D-alanyl-D-alanine ligase/alanine racemase [Adhaeribacter terrigena]MBK0404373.1 bifunctional UDP-N-acetylmuramoyl-tripeptide:D-alanyl-D-alanine ligase/alanine racemase [Adhaeribacter terrigena]